MLQRIDINPDNTEALLIELLRLAVVENKRVAFLAPSGHGARIMTRVRVMMSRRRKAITKPGVNLRRFRLCNTVHPESHLGIRYDCVVVWKHQTEIAKALEQFGDIMTPDQLEGMF